MTQMRLYRLQLKGDVDFVYDAPDGFIIVAPNPGTARAHAATAARHYGDTLGNGDDDPEKWIHSGRTECHGIGYAYRSYAEGTVIMQSIHHG